MMSARLLIENLVEFTGIDADLSNRAVTCKIDDQAMHMEWSEEDPFLNIRADIKTFESPLSITGHRAFADLNYLLALSGAGSLCLDTRSGTAVLLAQLDTRACDFGEFKSALNRFIDISANLRSTFLSLDLASDALPARDALDTSQFIKI